MDNELQTELNTFEKLKVDLLKKHKDKFVLIKGEELIDVFETYSDALRHGIDRFGADGFLIKQILEFEAPYNFTSNLIAI